LRVLDRKVGVYVTVGVFVRCARFTCNAFAIIVSAGMELSLRLRSGF
jgi:hypothetical protein